MTALFASSQDALRFALNASFARVKAPAMTAAMNAEPVAKDWMSTPSKHSSTPEAELKRGMDGAATAGQIMSHFSALPGVQQVMLYCRVMTPRVKCACSSPCCSGWRLSTDWSNAVEAVCLLLKYHAQLSQTKGKKGMSTHPLLRRALVEKFFDGKRRFVIHEIAEACDVSDVTVYAHKKVIESFLDAQEKDGWEALDLRMVPIGIVGSTD